MGDVWIRAWRDGALLYEKKWPGGGGPMAAMRECLPMLGKPNGYFAIELEFEGDGYTDDERRWRFGTDPAMVTYPLPQLDDVAGPDAQFQVFRLLMIDVLPFLERRKLALRRKRAAAAEKHARN